MNILISVQYPIAIIDIPNRLGKSFHIIKNDFSKWINDDSSKTMFNCQNDSQRRDVLSYIIKWLSSYLLENEEITVIKLNPNECEVKNFPNKKTIFI